MATASTPSASLITWKIDSAHTAAEFKVKHMMIANVKGTIKGITGDLTEHTSDATLSSIEATLDVSTLNTGEPDRDTHLKSADFFDVEKFPTLHFKSKSISIVRDGELAVEGDLTIRGVSRKVRFDVEGPTPPTKDPWGNTRVAISATTRINRKDFGLTWNAALETGGILVGDDVTITLDVEFVKA